MDETMADAYLARIGADRPTDPGPATLATLMERHLLTVPFENLSIHLGERIRLDEDSLLDKIVRRRRGGFCYELNGGFGRLLASLGYDVTLLAARVHGEHGVGPLFDHLALRVDLDERWLVDVGFGRFVAQPVRLDVRTEQADSAGTVRIVETEQGDLDVLLDGKPQIRLEQRARRIEDFAPTCWFQQTSPESHFRQSPVCSMPTATGGRITLSDRLLITQEGGDRVERTLEGDAEVLATYRERFGIVLDRLPTSPAPAP